MKQIHLDALNRRALAMRMAQGYVEALLFSEVNENDVPLERLYGPSNLSEGSKRRIVRWCASFLRWASKQDDYTLVKDRIVEAGYDLFFTQAHHGVGFWDGDWPEGFGKGATDRARVHPAPHVFEAAGVVMVL